MAPLRPASTVGTAAARRPSVLAALDRAPHEPAWFTLLVLDRFTDRARRVLALAQEEACRVNQNFTGTEHLLVGLLEEGESVAAEVLQAVGVTTDSVRRGQRVAPVRAAGKQSV